MKRKIIFLFMIFIIFLNLGFLFKAMFLGNDLHGVEDKTAASKTFLQKIFNRTDKPEAVIDILNEKGNKLFDFMFSENFDKFVNDGFIDIVSERFSANYPHLKENLSNKNLDEYFPDITRELKARLGILKSLEGLHKKNFFNEASQVKLKELYLKIIGASREPWPTKRQALINLKYLPMKNEEERDTVIAGLDKRIIKISELSDEEIIEEVTGYANSKE